MNLGVVEWALPRQLRTRDVLGRGAGARSEHSERLLPRTFTAERVVKSVCPYCSVGCAQNVYVRGEVVVHVEGDPDSPVSRGRLCPKGAAAAELASSPGRLHRCLYRAPHTGEWAPIGLDEAMDMVADRVVATRAATWEPAGEGGTPAGRTHGIAALAGAALDSEEQYLAQKLVTALGAAQFEPSGRGPHGATSAALGTSFGRGGSSSCLQDLQHADCILIEGSNIAESHPVGFQWVMEAKARGASVLHVDPRFTRTSALADVWVPLRAGTDIAFIGALIRHVLTSEAWFRDYVVAYTNAATILRDDFSDTEDLHGVFSGFQPGERRYDETSWQYEGTETPCASPEQDETLAHPRCVMNVLRRHYERYTPEMVERVCGVPGELFARVCRLVVGASGRERTAAFVYGAGLSQHAGGAQFARAASVLQLLLGNVGRPGGGVHALDDDAKVGSLAGLVKDRRGEARARRVSLAKSYWGPAATAANTFCSDYLPSDPASPDDACKGYFVLGANPLAGSPNARMQRAGMADLDWLVVRDVSLTESTTWWKDGPEIESGERSPRDIATEVFFFPAAAHTEKNGSSTNGSRMLQWHDKAVEPEGDARSDLWFVYHLGRRIRRKLAASDQERDRPLRELTWDYPVEGRLDEPSAEAVLAEMNGWDHEGRPLVSSDQLREDGSTACGCWAYCGVLATGVNHAALKKPASEQSWLAPDWGWSWPANRRILYNRASADPEGNPWSKRKALVWWDPSRARWKGHDAADFPADKSPHYRPPPGARGADALSGTSPFVAQPDGKGWIFAATGLRDGPLPTHYEPQESPVDNALYAQRRNPVRTLLPGELNLYHPSGSERGAAVYPYVLTTFGLAERVPGTTATRWQRHLSELQPALFVEVSPDLASERGLVHGAWATVLTARSAVEARVLVTDRVPPLVVHGRTVHQIAMPTPWGGGGYAAGDAPNELTSVTLDPNGGAGELKALTADVVAGRRPRGRERIELVEARRERAGISEETGMSVRT